MFEDDSADTCTGKVPLMLMGGQAEGLACADLGARTHIGVSGTWSERSAWDQWSIFSLLSPVVLTATVATLTEGVVIGFRKILWASNYQKYKDSNKKNFGAPLPLLFFRFIDFFRGLGL